MTAPLSDLAERLRSITDGGVDNDCGDQVQGLTPPLRVRPRSPEALAACLAAAQAHGAAVIPWGGGSQQRIGSPPARARLLLDTGGLDALLAWEPGDLTASFQAGVTLDAVQGQLATAGQQLAIDAPVPARATLGGLVATDACGPRRWRYGRWRDQIIGMGMALPSGELIKSGGRVVKNVQGYDLAKLFVGSLGSLGVITELNMRVVPLPPSRRLVWFSGEGDAVLRLLQFIAASTLRVSTLDLLDRDSGNRCGLASEGWLGLVLLEGVTALVEQHAAVLEDCAKAERLRAESIDGERLASVWRAWGDLGRTDNLTEEEVLMSLSCQPSEVPAAVGAIEELRGRFAIACRCWARVGNGNVYARLSAPVDKVIEAVPVIQQRLSERWPWTTVTAGAPEVARAAKPWGAIPPAIDVMRALKRRFDPSGVLQPGRYVGGI